MLSEVSSDKGVVQFGLVLRVFEWLWSVVGCSTSL
jgi:hypothetical protein